MKTMDKLSVILKEAKLNNKESIELKSRRNGES